MTHIPIKIAVHIAFFWHNENKTDSTRLGNNRSKYTIRVINDYLAKWDVDKVDVFIHTNLEKAKIIQDSFQLHDRISATFVVHSLENEHPFNLTWKNRDLIEKQIDEYDAFMYIEDDIGVPFETLEYWYTYKDALHEKNLDVGFVRVEASEKGVFCTDILIPSGHPLFIKDRVFVWNHQNYCAFWICDRNEMTSFMKSPYWKYHCYFPDGPGKPPSIFIQESSAIGFKMNYVGSFYPVSKTHKYIDECCFVHHLPCNLVNNNTCEQGKFNVLSMTKGLFQ